MAKSKKTASNAGEKLAKKRKSNVPDVGKATRFKKGYDPRRNLKGRPKSFDQFRALAQDIAEQIATTKDGKPLIWNGEEITFAEFILLAWATDKKYFEKFVEAAFGKVPQPIEGNGPDGSIPVTFYIPKNERDKDSDGDG